MKNRKSPRSLFARTEKKTTKTTTPEQAKSNHLKVQHAKRRSQSTAAVEETTTESISTALPQNTTPLKPVRAKMTELSRSFSSQPDSVNITQLRTNFESQRANRVSWNEADYSELILKLDRLTTEAFILKGKLLNEAKKRFFDANKQGWAAYCDTNMGMNYTTANQYIRVAEEFDVTSHQYPKLGFEHFKALLPIPPEERESLLSSFPGGSVKSLRLAVQQKLQGLDSVRTHDASSASARQMLKSLQQLTGIMAALETENLSQQMRWQLTAACNQVASQLLQLSNQTSDAFRNSQTGGIAGGSPGAFAMTQSVSPPQRERRSSEQVDPY